MAETFNVLLVEDNEKHQIIIQHELGKIDLDVNCTCLFLKEDYLQHLSEEPVDLIICDYQLPDFSGSDALEIKKNIKPKIPFILVSGMMGEDLAVEAMLSGASDYVMKDNLGRLNPAVKRELLNHYKQAQNEKKLAESVGKYKSLVQSIEGIVWEAEVNPLKFTFLSPKFGEILGFNLLEWNLNNDFWLEQVHPDDYEDVEKFYEQASSAVGEYHHEFRLLKEDKQVVWVMDSVNTISVENRLILRGLMVDTSLQRAREEKLKQTLDDKNTLLSEVHHRVKNNLAVISGMMQLQYFIEPNTEVQEKLLSSVGRIKTMALIHEVLYHSENFHKLDAGTHLQDIVELSRDHPDFEAVEINIQTEHIYLNINQAVPFFLIVHEVIDNTFHHANTSSKNCTIDIHIKLEDKQVTLKISDTGNKHKKPHNFLEDNQPSNGLGITIIKELTQQLDGECSYTLQENGAAFSLYFEKEDEQKGSTANNLIA